MTKLQILKIDDTPYKTKIFTENAVFIFTKSEKKPIFHLSIEGKVNTDLKISDFFTPSSQLSTFVIHGCDDFEG